uniref:Uncharacterized protein n=1 Tax=Glossina palpalis gambiensis TaxID=67801 RepID=A0A1B0BQS3_9MUSC
MAPALSRLRENQNVIIGLTGVSAALWIIAYGKSSQKHRRSRTCIFLIHKQLYCKQFAFNAYAI